MFAVFHRQFHVLHMIRCGREDPNGIDISILHHFLKRWIGIRTPIGFHQRSPSLRNKICNRFNDTVRVFVPLEL